MLKLHHLEQSRSQRVLWLLEEIGVPYELVRYQRTASRRAPPELSKAHQLGKSPVLVDNDLILAESAVILRYLNDRYGQGRFTPCPSSDEFWRHEEWLDYIESSAMLPVMIGLLGKMTGEAGPKLEGFYQTEACKVFDYIADGLGAKPFLMGEKVMLADIQMTYFLGLAKMSGLLDSRPTLLAYLDRLQQRPGFQRAEDKGGAMMAQAGG